MTQVPAELIEFEERLDNYEEIYISRVKDNTKKKTNQSVEIHQPTKLSQKKGSHQAAKPSE